MPCRSEIFASCYCADPGLVFPLNRPIWDEYMYYRRRRENESRYLVARKGGWIFAPHQCEKCWFVNLCGRCPDFSSLIGRQALVELRRDDLGIFVFATLQQFMECWDMQSN